MVIASLKSWPRIWMVGPSVRGDVVSGSVLSDGARVVAGTVSDAASSLPHAAATRPRTASGARTRTRRRRALGLVMVVYLLVVE
jgi:hypothetical protein